MENVFLQAMDPLKVESINKIKGNKYKLESGIITDLKDLYTVYVSNVDEQNSSKFNIRKQPNDADTIFFVANENSVLFMTKVVGYRIGAPNPEMNLGWITDKYSTCIGDSNFMANVSQPQGEVDVIINISGGGIFLDIINDISRILDYQQVAKKF